jgi:hypothetical protein
MSFHVESGGWECRAEDQHGNFIHVKVDCEFIYISEGHEMFDQKTSRYVYSEEKEKEVKLRIFQWLG